MIVRSGRPGVIRGTAPAVPGAAVSKDDVANLIQPFIFFEGKATTWVRLRNTGANVLRVFFSRRDVEAIAPASYGNYVTVPASPGVAGDPAFIEIPLELAELEGGDALLLMGEGGVTTFEALLGVRVV